MLKEVDLAISCFKCPWKRHFLSNVFNPHASKMGPGGVL